MRAACLVAALVVARDACAQRSPTRVTPPRTDTLSKRAFADSLKVVRDLEKQIKSRPTDAAAHYRRGIAALALSTKGSWKAPPMGVTRNEMDAIAAASLRNAAVLDSTNAEYWLAFARFAQTGTRDEQMSRERALARATSISRAKSDTATLVAALTQLAAIRWSAWMSTSRNTNIAWSGPDPSLDRPPPGLDPVVPSDSLRRMGTPAAPGANRPPAFVAPNSVWSAAGPDTTRDLPVLLATAIRRITRDVPRTQFDVPDSYAYRDAHDRMMELYALEPERPEHFRKLAYMLVSRAQWRELAGLAEERTQRAPRDAWSWLALGLAQHRLEDFARATASLDSGMTRLSAKERQRLDRVDRVLSWHDSVAFASGDAESKRSIEERTWLLGDPLWTEGTGRTHQEFLARLVFAELRWGFGSLDGTGAETDAGETYIRYGPPDARYGSFWVYTPDLIFTPRQAPAARRTQDLLEFYQINERIQDWRPSRWDNLTSTRIDSMATQVARFRAGRDSVSVFVAATAPVDSITVAGMRGGAVSTNAWLLGVGSTDTTRTALPTGPAGVIAWRQTVDTGSYYYRIETTAKGAARAGRTSGVVRASTDTATSFALTGFGLSDALVTTRIAEGIRPARWTDIDFTALTNDIPQGSTVGLVWETYDLAPLEGNAQYGVKIVIERKYKMFLNRVRARVISAWAAMMGSEQTSDRVVFRYERSMAHAPVVADYVTLALEDTPAGNYDLTLEITDRATGLTVSRTRRIVILD